MLSQKYRDLDLRRALLSQDAYRPFPKSADRAYWNALPGALRDGLIEAGERFLGCAWPALPATLHLEFKRNGNRSRYEADYFERRAALGSLALAECAEGRGRFLDGIVNGIWCVCEESSWCIPAHMGPGLPDPDDPVIDLFAAETAALLCWVRYLLKPELDGVNPAACARIGRETKLRVLDPYLKRDDFWWMGLVPHENGPVNNWNPWCNANCLTAFLLLEPDAARREAAVRKCLMSLDVFLETYREDGGCDEGTSYWGVAGGALFDCLEQLRGATGGAIDVYGEPLIGNIGRFIVRSHIAGEYYINFADGGAKAHIPAELVWRYGMRTGDADLRALGAYAFRLQGERCPAIVHGSLMRPLFSILNHKELAGVHDAPPLLRDAWMEGIGVMAARERLGSADGLYLAAKGGHNAESHNHNDVGSFVVYAGGKPVLIDVGVETYTAKTFSDDRYDIWTMQSQYHNLPTVNGMQQRDGAQYAAKEVHYHGKEEEVLFDLDLAAAYPEEAGIEAWKRQFVFRRGEKASIEIMDTYQLSKAESLSFSFMTCCEHTVDPAGGITFSMPGGGGVRMDFDGGMFTASTERIEVADERLSPVWGDHVYRIVLTAKKPERQGTARFTIVQVQPLRP